MHHVLELLDVFVCGRLVARRRHHSLLSSVVGVEFVTGNGVSKGASFALSTTGDE